MQKHPVYLTIRQIRTIMMWGEKASNESKGAERARIEVILRRLDEAEWAPIAKERAESQI